MPLSLLRRAKLKLDIYLKVEMVEFFSSRIPELAYRQSITIKYLNALGRLKVRLFGNLEVMVWDWLFQKPYCVNGVAKFGSNLN